jgi:hypothetical protein
MEKSRFTQVLAQAGTHTIIAAAIVLASSSFTQAGFLSGLKCEAAQGCGISQKVRCKIIYTEEDAKCLDECRHVVRDRRDPYLGICKDRCRVKAEARCKKR